MKKGYLSDYFDGVAAKILSSVEVNTNRSNQHEFNGVRGLRNILGSPDTRRLYDAQFLYLTDFSETPLVEDGSLTWYDARQRAREERGVDRFEYRLYFPENSVSQRANEGDVLVIAVRPDKRLLAIVVESDTTISQQLLWLFGFTDLSHPGFSVREELEADQDRISFISNSILETIGVTIQIYDDTYLDEMIGQFGDHFPSTKDFSEFSRSTVDGVDVYDGKDDALMAYMEREDMLFRIFEKHFLWETISEGFSGVEDFLQYSLSVQNRRKSRAGLALENHLEFIFKCVGIKYSRNPFTENKSKPDFVFPGIDEYQNANFSVDDLTLLGVKRTCKDRWRQVLSEGNRVEQKHLLTLEPAISHNQTDEMQDSCLQLVIPQKIQNTYSLQQQGWLMDIEDFTCHVLERQGQS